MAKDDWENQFKIWKKEESKGKVAGAVKAPAKRTEKIESERKTVDKNKGNNIVEPLHLKMVLWAIPVCIFLYLIYSNILVSQNFNYFYNIGNGKEQYLSPAARVSMAINDTPNYRNLTSGLVYFDVPVIPGADKVNIQIRFKDNFPKDFGLSLGAKDQDVWHYNYHQLYNPTFRDFSGFDQTGDVYRVDNSKPMVNLQELGAVQGVIIATDKILPRFMTYVEDYQKKESVISITLRGGHTFYVYNAGDLEMEVEKQDLNWYNGTDELDIAVYNIDNKLITNISIPDDGIDVAKKGIAKIQSGKLLEEGLPEGVYRIEFSDFDGLIRKIKINTNKIVADKFFLADNSIYGVDNLTVKIYGNNTREEQIKLLTYHSQGFQNISWNSEVNQGDFNFDKEDESLFMNMDTDKFDLTFTKGDVIVSGVGYFAFSRENYFEPYTQRIVGMESNLDWTKKNVDYIVTDYKKPESKDGWNVAETTFNINEDNLYSHGNKLSMVFNVPHLGQEEFINYTVPIDWINITVHKPGLLE
ncbi:MAG: hypothetical protein Q7S74_05800 [Nanoarchaeota archaeon]|nr:hypothetical protein [Nanoarchaeota archaeon]